MRHDDDWNRSREEWRRKRNERWWDEIIAAVGRFLGRNLQWIALAILIAVVLFSVIGKIRDTSNDVSNGITNQQKK